MWFISLNKTYFGIGRVDKAVDWVRGRFAIYYIWQFIVIIARMHRGKTACGEIQNFKIWQKYGSLRTRVWSIAKFHLWHTIMMASSNENIFRVTGHMCREFTVHRWIPRTQRPVTRIFDVFFDLRLNKCLRVQSWGWRFETTSRSLWRHCNDIDRH